MCALVWLKDPVAAIRQSVVHKTFNQNKVLWPYSFYILQLIINTPCNWRGFYLYNNF